jgi:hypothetical protein
LKWLVSLQSWYQQLQAPIIVALLVSWFVVAYDAPAFQTVSVILAETAGPLTEAVVLLAAVGLLFGACVMLIAGPYLKQWSNLSSLAQTLGEHILASAFRSTIEVLRPANFFKSLIQSTVGKGKARDATVHCHPLRRGRKRRIQST